MSHARLVKRLSDCYLYGIIDLGYVRPGDACSAARAMCGPGGVDILQLRGKGVPEEDLEALGCELMPIAADAGVPFIINDFPELVPAIGANGAHVGQDDRPVADARWRAGRALADEVAAPIIGKSTHSIEQAVAAEGEGADYIGFGPLFATPTKPGRPAIGLEGIRRVHELVTIPVFCIGGVNQDSLAAILAAGARRVVIVSGILQSPDIGACCREFRAMLGGPGASAGK